MLEIKKERDLTNPMNVQINWKNVTLEGIPQIRIVVTKSELSDPSRMTEIANELMPFVDKKKLRSTLNRNGFEDLKLFDGHDFKDKTEWLEIQRNAYEGSKLSALYLEITDLKMKLTLPEFRTSLSSHMNDLVKEYRKEMARIKLAEDKAILLQKNQNFPDLDKLVASNDRRGVASLVRMHLPWDAMEPCEKHYWENWLDSIVHPSPEKGLVFRGFGSGSPRRTKDGRNYFFSPSISSAKTPWNRRLRFLVANRNEQNPKFELKLSGEGKSVKLLRPRTQYMSFSEHNADWFSMGEQISMTTEPRVAQGFALDETSSVFRMGAIWMDRRRLVPNIFDSHGESEVLTPLIIFPDEFLDFQAIPRLEPGEPKKSNGFRDFYKGVEARLREKTGNKETKLKDFSINREQLFAEQIAIILGTSTQSSPTRCVEVIKKYHFSEKNE